MNLLIRADSSSTMGLGHIMRCLVLAQQYPDTTIAFACQNLDGALLEQIPYPVHILNSNEPQELITLIQKLAIEMIIFDHYDIDATFEKQIKEQTAITILSLDDTYQKHHCDILLNHNICADASRYDGLVPQYCELRCGGKFTLIREEFKHEYAIPRAKIYDIFISMGGADTSNITLEILKCIDPSKSVCIATTTANAHLTQLLATTLEKDSIEVHVNSSEIATLIAQSSLAIITPSVMVHEVMFMEVPFIAIQTAPNQREMANYLERHHFDVMHSFDSQALREKLS
jgi:UDP-2,4-diacetamido-2,4,6-trideoxy-beta-L-altropyranose hydrolase